MTNFFIKIKRIFPLVIESTVIGTVEHIKYNICLSFDILFASTSTRYINHKQIAANANKGLVKEKSIASFH